MGTVQELNRDDVTSQAVFRTVNDIIRDIDAERIADFLDFVCECENETCTRVLRMSGAEYDALRAKLDCFAVLAGHEREEMTDVVSRTDAYLIVRRVRPVAAPVRLCRPLAGAA